MTQVIRICKYGCKTQLGEFDTKQNKYLESDGTIHTRERCESLKPKQVTSIRRDDVELIATIIEGLQDQIVNLGKLRESVYKK